MTERHFVNNRGGYCITPLPGNPQVAVTHAFFVVGSKRGQGLAHDIKEDQIHTLKNDGYDYAICTVRADNEAQRKVVEKGGYRLLDRFFDRRQWCEICVYGKTVNE